nr:DNA-dependent protein kinase catalytic subunit isoform X2 [Parasteatoda tepidariorum]
MGDFLDLIQSHLDALKFAQDSDSISEKEVSILETIQKLHDDYLNFDLKEQEREIGNARIFCNDGILSLLRNLLIVKELRNVKLNCFKLLNDIIESSGSMIGEYGFDILEVCKKYMKQRDATAEVKKASMITISKILETCHGYNGEKRIDVKSLIEDLFFQLTTGAKLSPKAKEEVLCLIGIIAHYYPEDFIPYQERVLSMFLQELKSQMSAKVKAFNVSTVAGCLLGLKEYLYNFSVMCSEDTENSYFIFDTARKLISNTEKFSSKSSAITRAGLQLLAAHAIQFNDFIFEDCIDLYEVLLQWVKHHNREMQKLGKEAVVAVLKVISEMMMSQYDERKDVCANIFKYFMNCFRDIFLDKSTTSKELQIAVMGYGLFAGPCKLCLSEVQVKKMLQNVIQKSEHEFFSGGKDIDDKIVGLNYYIEALSSIVSVTECMTDNILISLEKLVVFQIDKFPKVPTAYNFIVSKAIIRMFLAVLPKRDMFIGFLSQIVYQGIVKTCSHPVVVEAEAMKDSTTGKEDNQKNDNFISASKIITYKDYLTLWRDMLNVVRFKELNSLNIPLERRQYLMECIYDEIIRSSLNLLNKLDLSLQQPEFYGKEDDNESEISCDPLHGVQPNNMIDYYIFINLVDFLRDLLSHSCTELFSKWVFVFGKEMIFYAVKYPFHSGFYKLISMNLSICSKIGYFKTLSSNTEEMSQEFSNDPGNLVPQSYTLFSKFVKEIAVQHTQFRDDLLASCLQVMLVLPMEIVAKEIHSLIPALESALKLGLSYLPLAEKAVNALEKWSTNLELNILKPYFPRLLPLLNSYLLVTAAEAGSVLSNEKRPTKKAYKMSVKSMKRSNKNTSSDNSLEDPALGRIQLQILKYLGQLGENNVALLEQSHQKVDEVAIAWDPLCKNHLKYSVPFVDMKPNVYFDEFLPRILEIATKSSVRQVKVAACEALHSLVLFMIGQGSMLPDNLQEKYSMEALYEKLFPGLLELSCDVEQVTKQLFSPLVLQMIHWFTCKKVSSTPESSVILLSLWDGVTNPKSAALRDFSAICLKEYFLWSIKQSSAESKPVERLLSKLHSFSLHPNSFKRLGAALTFNSLYNVFRNEDFLVRKYTLQLLVLFVDSLAIAHTDSSSLRTQEQCVNALNHLEKIIVVKHSLFIKSEKSRKKPECLEEATLQCIVLWLLKQCGCVQTECRHKCMDLVIKFAPFSPGSQNLSSFIITYENCGKNIIEDVFEAILQDSLQSALKNQVSYKSLSRWLEALQTSMECYQWAFSKQLMLQNMLCEEKNASLISCIKVFNAIEHFLENIVKEPLTALISKHYIEESDVFIPGETLKYNRLKCTVLIRLLNFITSVFATDAKWFHDKFLKVLWNSNLWELILLLVVNPTSLGFEMTDPEIATKLPMEVSIVVSKLSKKSEFHAFCLEYLKSKNGCNLEKLLPLKLSDPRCNSLQMTELLNGYDLLLKNGFHANDLFNNPDKSLNNLLDSIWTDSSICCISINKNIALNPASLNLAEKILKVAYKMDLQVQNLAKALLETTKEEHSKLVVTKGLLVFNLFTNSISLFAAKSAENFVKTIASNLNHQSFNEISILLKFIDCVACSKILRKKHGKQVIDAFLNNWNSVCVWWRDHPDIDSIYSVLSLMTKMLLIDSKVALNESNQFSMSILPTYLTMLSKENNTMDFIVHALDILPFFCESSTSSENSTNLRSHLEEMMVNHFPLQSTEFVPGSSAYHTYISALKNMLSALSLTGCGFLFEILTSFFCKESEHVLEVNFLQCITDMLKSKSSSHHQLYADIVFSLIMKSGFDSKSDVLLKIVNKVLILVMQNISLTSFINFFLSHIKEIMKTVKENLSLASGVKDIHLVKRICCFKLLELMYSTLNKDLLHSKESQIVETYLGRKPEVGNELSTDITKLTLEFKKFSYETEPEYKVLLRKLNCAKYCALIAVVSCTQNELKFYNAFLFKENPAKNEYIWKRIVDEDIKLTFSMEIDDSVAKKNKFLAIRHQIRKVFDNDESERDISGFQSSLQIFGSENLELSSLAEDVSKFVFTTNEQIFKPEGINELNKSADNMSSKNTYVADYLELDDLLNQHECMLSMLSLIRSMKNKSFISDEKAGAPPAWLSAIVQSLEDRKSSDNVKLFLGRFITNNAELFQPYAEFLMGPILNLIVLGTAGFSLNYFILDVIITTLSWASVAIPQGNDMLKASEVLKFVMMNIEHSRRDIFRNNLELVKTILECWKSLKIPYNVIYEKMSDFSPESKQNHFGIQLLGVVLSCDFPPYDLQDEAEGYSFLTTLLKNLSMKYKEVYGAAAEVIALTLQYISKSETDILKNKFFLKVSQVLDTMKHKEESKFLYCLNKIHSSCPKIANKFIPHLLFLYSRVHGIYKNYILEIFYSRVLEFENSYQELKHIGVFENLEKKNDIIQHLSLQTLEKLVPNLSCDDILHILPSIVGIHTQPNSHSRLALFKILFLLFEKFSDSSGAKEKEITRYSRETLLNGLADPDPSIRLIVDNFWSNEKRLPLGTVERLIALMKNMSSPVTEESFLQYSTFLLLERTSYSPDYKRKIFEYPLSQCNFQAYKIQTSARKRHMAMSPLFTETATSSIYSSLMSLDASDLTSFRHDLKLKATQVNIDFPETLDVNDDVKKRDTYNWLTEKSLDTFAPQMSSGDSGYSSFTNSPVKTHLFALKNENKSTKTKFQIDLDENEKNKEKKSTTWMLKKRFLKDKANSEVFARQELRRQDRRKEILKDQRSHRDAQVTMYRQYRIGELPDIEISNSAIIQPVQALAMNDVSIAKLLLKSLLSAICTSVKEDFPEGFEAFCAQIGSCFENILQKSYLYFPPLMSFCLETLNDFPNIRFDVETVFNACIGSSQQSIGILLLETQLLDGLTVEPKQKKIRHEKHIFTQESNYWMKLAELYRSINDYDVVNGIFSLTMGKRDDNKRALQHECLGQYFEAAMLYNKLYEEASDEHDQAEKDFWDKSVLNCLNKLSKWENLESAAQSRFMMDESTSLLQIWEDQYMKDVYLPYLVRSKLKLLLNGKSDPSLLNFFDESRKDDENKTHLEIHFNEELALLYVVQDKFKIARQYSSSCLHKFLKEWQTLSQVALEMQHSVLQNLQKYVELDEFLNLIDRNNSYQYKSAIKTLKYWQKRLPNAIDPVDIWDDVIANRQLYIQKLGDKFGNQVEKMEVSLSDSLNNDSIHEDDFKRIALNTSVHMKIRFAENCAAKGNFPVAVSTLKNIYRDSRSLDGSTWSKFIEAYCSVNNQRVLQSHSEKSLDIAVGSYKQLGELEKRCGSGVSQKKLLSETLELIARMFMKDKSLFDTITNENMAVISSLSNGKSDLTEIVSEILDQSYSSLKNITMGTSGLANPVNDTNRKSVAAAHMELANFCNRYLCAENAKNFDLKKIPSFNEFPRILIESLLDALKYGSTDAHLLFPRLLQIIENNPSCLQVFEEKVSKMPCWLFIGWIDQMVALLDKPEAKAVQCIIEKIALTYPNAIIYAFHLSSGSYKFSNSKSDSSNKKFVDKIKAILEKETLITDFVTALDHLSVPSVIFKDYVNELVQSVSAKTSADKVKEIFTRINDKLFNPNAAEKNRRVTIGPLHKKFSEEFKDKFLAICGKDGCKLMKEKESKVALKALSDLVAEAKKKDKKLSSLKDASPWLYEFQQWKYSSQIEIPGQYTGRSKPLPEYHVKIAGFDGKVLVLSSLTAPRRITIRGNDEKEYKILVKSGEDLRQDARIQQMFSVMNEIYAKDVNCAQRHLYLKTYKVVPLSTRLGLIEWVDNTTVLNDFLNDGMSETERKQFYKRDGNLAQSEILQWDRKAENIASMYHSFYMKKTREECIQKYEKIVNFVPKNLLKKSFLKLSSSPEAFIALRTKFAKSHAVICISQWIIGIGDRHLGNFLIDKTSGCEIGIDFGHAFGSATQFLPVPELVPFRLTPQYLQLMAPLKVKGIYEATMIHALKAISTKRDLLLNVMDIFIKEPTLDWMNLANKQKQIMGTHNEGKDDWFPRQRILIARKKLEEFNPCYITRKELELGHSMRPCFQNMVSVCIGDASHNLRAQLKKSGLSVEEKNESLIDQATDPYLLCLTYFGWNPWM